LTILKPNPYAPRVIPLLFRRELCFIGLDVKDAIEAMLYLARSLFAAGLVRPSFEAAVIEREVRSPTGLPLLSRNVAIPHTDPEHVLAPGAALCTLAQPVTFREMGNPAQELAVEIVVMLALPDHDSAQRELVRVIERLQAPELREKLCSATQVETLFALLQGGEA
jgi:galactitol PTS system EIIA component